MSTAVQPAREQESDGPGEYRWTARVGLYVRGLGASSEDVRLPALSRGALNAALRQLVHETATYERVPVGRVEIQGVYTRTCRGCAERAPLDLAGVCQDCPGLV